MHPVLLLRTTPPMLLRTTPLPHQVSLHHQLQERVNPQRRLWVNPQTGLRIGLLGLRTFAKNEGGPEALVQPSRCFRLVSLWPWVQPTVSRGLMT